MYIKQKEFLFVFFNCSEANKFHEQKPLKTEKMQLISKQKVQPSFPDILFRDHRRTWWTGTAAVLLGMLSVASGKSLLIQIR
jgi:hypothetical protein